MTGNPLFHFLFQVVLFSPVFAVPPLSALAPSTEAQNPYIYRLWYTPIPLHGVCFLITNLSNISLNLKFSILHSLLLSTFVLCFLILLRSQSNCKYQLSNWYNNIIYPRFINDWDGHKYTAHLADSKIIAINATNLSLRFLKIFIPSINNEF